MQSQWNLAICTCNVLQYHITTLLNRSIRNKFIFNSLFVYDSRIYQLPLLPLELFDACLESVELVLFIFTFIPPPPELLLDEGIEFAGEAGILGDPGKEDDLKFCC